MADTILGGDITVTYLDEARQKMLSWTGTATGTRSMNEVYSALANLFDEQLQMDNPTVMFADTPVEYTIGTIDAGDLEPWYIQYDCVQHFTGGSLRTSGWTHTNGSAVGIVVVPVANGGTIVAADIGFTMSHAVGDSGVLLDILDIGAATDYLVIRPATNAIGNSFDSTTGVITSARGAFTATQNAASNTGEQIWANLFNVTPVEADTHVYMYQGLVSDATRSRVFDITAAAQDRDWWAEGAFDRLIYIHDFKTSAFSVIDAGNVNVFSRKGNTLYDNFEVATSLTSGGRNPVPLSPSADLNNTTGYQSITQTVNAGNWNVGNEVQGDTSGARGIITKIVTPGATQTLHYYLIGDPQITFNTTAETITNNDDTGTGTKDAIAPANQGPALASWFTSGSAPLVTHGNTTFDTDDDGTAEGYAMILNASANPLTQVYEWTKYITRNGSGTAATDTDNIEGEQYVGSTTFLHYSGAVTGAITEGNDVTQAVSGATGIVVSHDIGLKEIVLRDSRGAFVTAQMLTDNDSGGTISSIDVATNFNPVKNAPFGTLAGGRFFGARSTQLFNWLPADENNFQLIDSAGVGRSRPIAITMTVSNLVGTNENTITDDRVAIFRLTAAGGIINKTEYSAAAGVIGDATVTIDTGGGITADTPGKTAGGVLRIRDNSNGNKEYRLRFSSWTGSIFTLANIVVASADAGTNTTTVVEAAAFGSVKRGDLVLNTTRGNAVSYVTNVVDANTITIFPAIALQAFTDVIEINAVPITLNTLDDVYVPLMDKFATASSEQVSLVSSALLDFRVICRNVANATKIKPFTTDGATTGTNTSNSVIRNTDTIFT